MDGLIDGWSWTEAYYYSSITGSRWRWYRAQLRGAQFGTPNRAPAPRGPDNDVIVICYEWFLQISQMTRMQR